MGTHWLCGLCHQLWPRRIHGTYWWNENEHCSMPLCPHCAENPTINFKELLVSPDNCSGDLDYVVTREEFTGRVYVYRVRDLWVKSQDRVYDLMTDNIPRVAAP
jgi:hypothetical protein